MKEGEEYVYQGPGHGVGLKEDAKGPSSSLTVVFFFSQSERVGRKSFSSHIARVNQILSFDTPFIVHGSSKFTGLGRGF